MGDDYFLAIKFIAYVKDVDSISCDAVINRLAHCDQCYKNMPVLLGRDKPFVYVLQHAVF
jgi:hypothetical protein